MNFMTKLQAPWYTYQKKLNALFALDNDITVGEIYKPDDDECTYAIDIEIRNHEKFMALDRVIAPVVEFGNVKLRIVLYDEENTVISSGVDLYKTIFKGNPIVKDIRTLTDPMGFEHGYVRFKPEVVQFPNDDISDFNGNWNGLAEDIAREVFTEDRTGINFCTVDIHEVGEAADSKI